MSGAGKFAATMFWGAIIFLIIFGVVLYFILDYNNYGSEAHEHSWIVQNVDGETVEFCEDCGKQKSFSEHSHSWKAQKVDDKIVVVCEECGKLAEE